MSCGLFMKIFSEDFLENIENLFVNLKNVQKILIMYVISRYSMALMDVVENFIIITSYYIYSELLTILLSN